MRDSIGSWLGALFVSGCATVGFGPTDTLGVAGHELAARGYERSAAEHRRNAGNFAPSGCTATLTGCPPGTVNVRAASEFEQAESDQRLADQHRGRMAELRDAEQRSCTGIDEHDRDANPLPIEQVIRMETALGSLKTIVVSVKNEGGTAVDRFARIIGCHLAHNNARGLAAAEPGSCPLVPGTNATVRAEGPDFTVIITAKDDVAAQALQQCAHDNPETLISAGVLHR